MTNSLSTSELLRFKRNIALPGVGLAGQTLLSKARVLCVGAGGLGIPNLQYLAAAGVGTIGIVDFDVVEITNLQRQVIYRESDLGRKKVDLAQQVIQEINSQIDVITFDVFLDATNALAIISEFDIVIDATDNFPTRYLVNDACVILNKPLAWGSILRFDGQVSVFASDQGPCYRCLAPTPPDPGVIPNCAEAGVLGVLCSIIGSMQCNEVIKLITGVGETLVGKIAVFDSRKSTLDIVRLGKNPECVMCNPSATPPTLLNDYFSFCGISKAKDEEEITAIQLQQELASSTPPLLIDVRELNEFEFSALNGAVLIESSKILNGAGYSDLPLDRKVIFYCRSGKRSLTCLRKLKSEGYENILSLAGGITSWAELIDPDLEYLN